MKTLVSVPNETLNLPTIIVPIVNDGFHSHKGDSFREMVSLWESKGYISVKRSATNFVWLGETLLYDRANYDWLNKDPEPYKKILCGNPDASQIVNGIQWSFWPRNPKLVEALAPSLVNTERTKTLVFYGAAENNVQKSHRSNRLYEACDEYSLTDGTTYKYTPSEYLHALAQSKFGLCLAGYGPKCNREIECMALGTVPLVAPDVDMTNYYEPPQEGLHYIRLKTFDPEEASEAIKISHTRWQIMSAAAVNWWKVNASAHGLWELTKKLAL